MFSKREPLQVLHGLGDDYLDTEGRICALEFPELWFVDVYTPNAQDGLALPDGSSAEAKPVVMCGDFNVAHQEIDLKNPKSNRGNAGFSDEERGKFTDLLDAGFADTFRLLHPDATGIYSWWSYRFNARKNNAGWRIDYFLVSDAMRKTVEAAEIHGEVMGSDHCPISLTLDL